MFQDFADDYYDLVLVSYEKTTTKQQQQTHTNNTVTIKNQININMVLKITSPYELRMSSIVSYSIPIWKKKYISANTAAVS